MSTLPTRLHLKLRRGRMQPQQNTHCDQAPGNECIAHLVLSLLATTVLVRTDALFMDRPLDTTTRDSK
jgi:hypothetical protein